jgi:nucleotidyltransferase/DNA polymerase involved in DNA repair
MILSFKRNRVACSHADRNKPNGQFALPPEKDAVLSFMEPLPVKAVSGIGKVKTYFLYPMILFYIDNI